VNHRLNQETRNPGKATWFADPSNIKENNSPEIGTSYPVRPDLVNSVATGQATG
jgi:hypothetical protein